MRRLAAGFTVLAALAAAWCAWADPSVWDDIWRSESAVRRTSVVGEARTRALLGPRTQEATASVRAAEGKVRLDYRAGRRRWTVIDDGRRLIRLDHRRRRAVAVARPEWVVDKAVAQRNYHARAAGEAKIAGRPAQLIEVSRRRRGPLAWRLWLDRETSFALKQERYNADGRLTSGTEYDRVEFGAPVPPDTFSIPEGWEVVSFDGEGKALRVGELGRQVGFPVIEPGYLPPGYVSLGGYVQQRGRWDVEVAELRYTDGLRVLSVSQRPSAGPGPPRGGGRGGGPGRRAGPGGGRGGGRGGGGRGGRGLGLGPPRGEPLSVLDRGTEKVVRYFGSKRVVVVVGDLAAEELVKVAKSLD